LRAAAHDSGHDRRIDDSDLLEPAHPEAAAADALVRQRQPSFVSYADWLKLDAIEVAQGRAQGRPRVKLTSVEEMLAALGR